MVIWIFAAIIVLVICAMSAYGDYQKDEELRRERQALRAAADSWNKATRKHCKEWRP